MTTDIAASNAHEIEELQDRLDATLMRLARMEQANDETVPFKVVQRLSDGEVPLTVWREHRGLSRTEIAAAAHVEIELLEAVEAGKEDVPLRAMHRIAQALRVDLDDLVPWSQEDEEHVQAAQGH